MFSNVAIHEHPTGKWERLKHLARGFNYVYATMIIILIPYLNSSEASFSFQNWTYHEGLYSTTLSNCSLNLYNF